ncbi:MAG: hypothetical protein JST96_04525, partial [Bacteroidetes bacterium]|nr:hypothetical protein [Bacteroidota bacterium]
KLTWLAAIILFAGNINTVFAQTLKDVFNNSETPILYLGVDFTKNKIIDEATANAMDIRDRQYASINDVVINEAKKYDFKEAFHKSFVDHDLSFVTAMNSKINAEQILSTNTADFHRLKESDIEAVVRSYSFSGKKGIGLLLIAEGVSKSEKSMALWVTLIDMSSKKMLMTERIEGKLAGFGFRNYIASGVKSVLDIIEKHKYKEWKSKYGN